MEPSGPSDLVAVACIRRPRGIRGEVLASVLTDFPDRFDGLERVVGIGADNKRLDLIIERHWFQNGRIVLKLQGYDTMDAAEALRGLEICVPEADVVDLDEGEFFDWQLAGCSVETDDGTSLGTVRELMRTGGPELLVVDAPDGREHLIPFAEAICTSVDIEGKRIVVDLPDGLLDL